MALASLKAKNFAHGEYIRQRQQMSTVRSRTPAFAVAPAAQLRRGKPRKLYYAIFSSFRQNPIWKQAKDNFLTVFLNQRWTEMKREKPGGLP